MGRHRAAGHGVQPPVRRRQARGGGRPAAARWVARGLARVSVDTRCTHPRMARCSPSDPSGSGGSVAAAACRQYCSLFSTPEQQAWAARRRSLIDLTPRTRVTDAQRRHRRGRRGGWVRGGRAGAHAGAPVHRDAAVGRAGGEQGRGRQGAGPGAAALRGGRAGGGGLPAARGRARGGCVITRAPWDRGGSAQGWRTVPGSKGGERGRAAVGCRVLLRRAIEHL